MRSAALSQCSPASDVVMCAERGRPVIVLAEAFTARLEDDATGFTGCQPALHYRRQDELGP